MNSINNTLTVDLQTIDEKVMFNATSRDNQPLIVDYFPPIGTGKGYTSLELLMIAFGSCVSTTLLTLLRFKMKKNVAGISAQVKGIMREQHPKKLECIILVLKIDAQDLTEIEVKTALKVAEDTLCPVWAMIKDNVTVEVNIKINE